MFYISPLLLDKEVQLIEQQYLARAAKEELIKMAKNPPENNSSFEEGFETKIRRWFGYKFIWFGEKLLNSPKP